MRASGWNVIDIEDGCFDIAGIVDALEASKKSDKPTFINVRTVIGLDSKAAGTADAHGAAFGAPDVSNMKKLYGFDPEQHFVIGDEVRDFFAELPARGEAHVREWDDLVKRYEEAYPELGASFRSRVAGELLPTWKELVPKPGTFPEGPTASRAASGLVLNPIAKELDNFMVGTADLSPSVHMTWPGKVAFQHVSSRSPPSSYLQSTYQGSFTDVLTVQPDLTTGCGIKGSYAGRYIHYGIREHAMCAIANGLAAYSRGTIIPVTSSFFMFYLYAAPAVRMGKWSSLHFQRAAGSCTDSLDRCAPAAAGHSRGNPRLYRSRRGRADASAHRASDALPRDA